MIADTQSLMMNQSQMPVPFAADALTVDTAGWEPGEAPVEAPAALPFSATWTLPIISSSAVCVRMLCRIIIV